MRIPSFFVICLYPEKLSQMKKKLFTLALLLVAAVSFAQKADIPFEKSTIPFIEGKIMCVKIYCSRKVPRHQTQEQEQEHQPYAN